MESERLRFTRILPEEILVLCWKPQVKPPYEPLQEASLKTGRPHADGLTYKTIFLLTTVEQGGSADCEEGQPMVQWRILYFLLLERHLSPS